MFVVRHGSRPRYPLSSVVADMRRSVRFIHQQHAKEHGIPTALASSATAPGDTSRCCSARPATRGIRRPPTPCSGNPVASRRSWRTIRGRIWLDWRCSTCSSTLPRPKRQSSLRFVSSLPDQPSLIAHGDADTSVPIDHGETMYAALMKAGVPASFIPIRGAGHGFEGADAERAFAALIQWFEQHLGVQPVADAAAAARDGDAELRTAEELRAAAAGTDRRVTSAICGRPGVRDGVRRQRHLEFSGRRGDSRCRDRTSIPIACRDAARSRRRMACWWRPMAARGVCRRPHAATMRRSPETGGRSRRRRDGLFAKEHGGDYEVVRQQP